MHSLKLKWNILWNNFGCVSSNRHKTLCYIEIYRRNVIHIYVIFTRGNLKNSSYKIDRNGQNVVNNEDKRKRMKNFMMLSVFQVFTRLLNIAL